MPSTAVATCGFERGMGTAHVSDVVRQTLCDAERWGGGVAIGQGDIKTAFDSFAHDAMSWGMLKRHVLVGLI